MYFELFLFWIQRQCSPRACPQLGEHFHGLAWPDFGLQFWKMPGQLTCYIGIVRIHAGSFVLIQLCLHRCSSPLRLWKASSVHRIGHIKTSSECFCRLVSVIWECLKPKRNRYIYIYTHMIYVLEKTEIMKRFYLILESHVLFNFRVVLRVRKIALGSSITSHGGVQVGLGPTRNGSAHLVEPPTGSTSSRIATVLCHHKYDCQPHITVPHYHSPLATIISIDHWFVGFLVPGLRRLFLWLRSMKRKVTTSRRAQPVGMCSELRNLDRLALDGKVMLRFKGESCNCQRVPKNAFYAFVVLSTLQADRARRLALQKELEEMSSFLRLIVSLHAPEYALIS